MAKVKIYRVGSLEVGQHSQEVQDFWGAMDAMKPSSHPTGRTDAIYASPNLHGILRWIQFAIRMGRSIEVHEVVVESDDVMAYDIPAYDLVPTSPDERSSERFISDTTKFWNSGVTLTEWLKHASPEDGSETEVLLDPARILSSRTLTPAMLVGLGRASEQPT